VAGNETLTVITGCPTCGADFTGWTSDYTQVESFQCDGAALSPVLAGRTVVEHSTPELLAWVLEPCGCRVSPDEWQMRQTVDALWFARPGDVVETMRQALS
jgi:hypothetical protein